MRWNELTEEEKAYRRAKEATVEDLKRLTTLVRSANKEEFEALSNQIKDVLENILRKQLTQRFS